jgi:hypothetical protein
MVSSRTDVKGTAMESAITAKKRNILIIAPDECLFTPLDTSFIDITLAGDKITNTSWSYLDLPSLSDHPYITSTFSLSARTSPKIRTSHPVHKLQHVTIETLLDLVYQLKFTAPSYPYPPENKPKPPSSS